MVSDLHIAFLTFLYLCYDRATRKINRKLNGRETSGTVPSGAGGVAEVIEKDGKLLIKGHGCPISKAVQADARSCLTMESLLARLTGLPVHERCDHGERPGCCFEIELPAPKRTGSRG